MLIFAFFGGKLKGASVKATSGACSVLLCGNVTLAVMRKLAILFKINVYSFIALALMALNTDLFSIIESAPEANS